MPGLHRVRRMAAFSMLMLAAGLAEEARGQGREEPFASLTIGVGGLSQVNRNGLSRGWTEPSGGELSFSAPFYVGAVEAGVQVLPFRSRLPEAPSFDASYFFLGWGEAAKLPAGVRLEGGFRVGLMQMEFEGGSRASAQTVEREVRTDALAGLSVGVGRAWRVGAHASYGVLLLAEPQRQVFVHVGLRRQFRTPAGLRRLLE